MEYRMYGLVPYNLSPIQQGIQYGHALQEYNNLIREIRTQGEEDAFDQWRFEDKTFIILNGGTTNKNRHKLGTLNQHAETLVELGFRTAEFYEPDLGDQLTAVVFLVSEKVFNSTDYPDYKQFVINELGEYVVKEVRKDGKLLEIEFPKLYKKWCTLVGPKVIEQRNFIKQFRLA